MKRVIIILLAGFLFLSLYSQSGGGFGGPMFGYYMNEMDDLNATISSITGKSLVDMDFQMGGGGYAVMDGLIIGGYGYGGEQVLATDSLSLKYSIGGGAFEFGRLWDVRIMHIGVIGKIGSSEEVIRLEPKPLINVSLDSLLTNPGRTSVMKRGGFETGLSLMGIFPIKNWISIALKGGVSYGFSMDWKLEDGGDILNSPQDRPLRYDISVGVMFGMLAGE